MITHLILNQASIRKGLTTDFAHLYAEIINLDAVKSLAQTINIKYVI